MKWTYKHSGIALALILSAAIVVSIFPNPQIVHAGGHAGTLSVLSTTTGTSGGNFSVTVPSGCSAGCTVVFYQVINDGDSAHTNRDSSASLDGITMTDPLGGQARNSPYVVDMWYIANYTGGTGTQTVSPGNHGGYGNVQWTVKFITGAATSPLDGHNSNSTNTSSNPSLTLTTTGTNDLIFDSIGGANSISVASGQTVDASSGTYLVNANRSVTSAGSYTESYTMTAGTSAMGIFAIAPTSGGGGGIPNGTIMQIGMGF
jgi:hypothetical protein